MNEEKKEWEYSAEERQYALNLVQFMQETFPTVYRKVTEVFAEYTKHKATLATRGEPEATVAGASKAATEKGTEVTETVTPDE